MEEETSYSTTYPDQQQNWDLNSDFEQIQEQQALNVLTLPHSERGIAGFVSKLYQCLQSNDSNPKYVRWCRHNGKDMFVIDCIPEFTKVVLPRLFKHCKFPSFVRQLNIYGFQRDTDARKSKDTKDKDSCRWYHPYFRPNRRDLFHLIRRKAIRYSRKKSTKPSIEEDPDTILTISGDDEEEEELNQENLLYVNNNETSSPVSSVIQHTDALYSSLNHENEQEDMTQNTNILLESDSHHVLSDNDAFQQENTIFSDQQENPIFSENDAHILAENEAIQNSSFIAPDETESYNPYMDPSLIHNEPFLHIQNLELQLHQLKLKYDRTEEYFKKQLQNAHIHINQQQRRIQELEYALSATKSVKQETQTGGYIDTMTNSLMHGNYIPIHAPNMNQQLYAQQQQWLYSHQQPQQPQQPQQQNDHLFKYM